MANEFEFFPIFYRVFMTDPKVEVMSTTEVGAYVLLLFWAWDQQPVGSLPDDDAILARWARLDPVEWSGTRPKVFACFKRRKDGRWHQKRMQQVYQDLKNRKKEKRELASRAAKAKWSKEKHADALRTHCAGNAKLNLNQKETTTGAAAEMASPGEREGADILALQGFPVPEALRLAALGGLIQVKAAVSNADYLERTGQIRKDKRGYIVKAIEGRYPLLDGAGRYQMQAEKKASALAGAEKAKKNSETEAKAEKRKTEQEDAVLSELPKERLEEIRTRVIEGANNVVRGKVEGKTWEESPLLRSLMLSELKEDSRRQQYGDYARSSQ